MKKIIALILALFLCFSLVACDSSDGERALRKYKDKVEELEEMVRQQEELVRQQEELIASLRAQLDGDIAQEDKPLPDEPMQDKPAVDEPAPTPDPVYEEIAITLDNWQTYFEITFEPTFYKNAFDEWYRLALPYYFKLKDEYFDRLDEDSTKLIFESSYDYGLRFCTVDYDAQTYVLGEYVNQSYPMHGSQIVERMSYNPTMGMYYTESFRGGTGMMDKNQYGTSIMVYDNFEILRIQGTLCLRVE